jgi:sporulation protein YlmC with PRC-barrel domain
MFQLLLNKKTFWSVAAMVALLFAVLPVRASDWLTNEYQEWKSTPGQESMHEKMSNIPGRIDNLQCAKSLLRADIKNGMGESLGSVRELILDDNRDVISYVVIESRGRFHPVPWSAFHVTPDNIVLNVDKIRFLDSPRTGSAYFEILANPDFQKDVRNYYSEQIAAEMKTGNAEEAPAASTEKPALRELSRLVGLKVHNIQRESLASVKTIIFDTRDGKVTYAVVGFGGLLGLGEKIAAVPWASLALQPTGNVAYLDADRASLEKAVVDAAHPLKLTEPAFARNLNEIFGAKPYWETLGFVPPGETKISMDAWRADSEYNKFFNPERVSTIDGVIRNVGIFTPEWGATAGLKLTVEIGENELAVIHCGPEQYAEQRQINFKPGTHITVTGSKVEIGGESVIMASEIKAADKTLLLRDEMGTPRWNVDNIKEEMENAQMNEYQEEEQHLSW